MTDEESMKLNERLDVGSKLTLLFGVLLSVGMLGSLVFGIMTNTDTAEIRGSSDEQACMSIWNGRKERAVFKLDSVRAELEDDLGAVEDVRDDAYLQVQVAAQRGDQAAVDAIVARAPDVQRQLVEARRALRDGLAEARKERDAALDEYLDAAELRLADPKRFLQQCPIR